MIRNHLTKLCDGYDVNEGLLTEENNRENTEAIFSL